MAVLSKATTLPQVPPPRGVPPARPTRLPPGVRPQIRDQELAEAFWSLAPSETKQMTYNELFNRRRQCVGSPIQVYHISQVMTRDEYLYLRSVETTEAPMTDTPPVPDTQKVYIPCSARDEQEFVYRMRSKLGGN